MVPTCSVRKASASSEMLRCRPAVRNRGQPALRTGPAVSTPEQHAGGQQQQGDQASGPGGIPQPGAVKLNVMPGTCGPGPRRLRQPPASRPRSRHRPVVADQPGRQAQAGQPARGPLAADDRGRAGRVRVHAAGGGHAHRAPACPGGQAGRGSTM